MNILRGYILRFGRDDRLVESKTPLRGRSLLVAVGIMLGHLGYPLHETIQGCALDQAAQADPDACYAAFPNHAAYMFNKVFERFGSLFCGDELVQIRQDRGHSYRE